MMLGQLNCGQPHKRRNILRHKLIAQASFFFLFRFLFVLQPVGTRLRTQSDTREIRIFVPGMSRPPPFAP